MRQSITLLTCLAAVACSSGSDSDSDSDSGAGASTGAALTTYVGFTRIDPNPGGTFPTQEFSSIQVGNRNFDSSFGVINDVQGGLALDYFGNAYQTNILISEGEVRVTWSLAKRSFETDTAVGNTSYDRSILGFNTTLIEPRNVAIAHSQGFIMVTDTSDALIKVWGTAAGGDVAPLFTANPGAAPWDVAYDDASDRLFAALTNGTIAVFDDFVATQPSVSTRTIVPSLDGSTQASISLRGISIDPSSAGERLVVTDFGLEESGIDGALWEIDGASLAAGPTAATRVGGDSTGLRGPVDVVVAEDGLLRVADSEGNRLSIFSANVFSAQEPRPILVRPLDRPAGIALEPASPVRTVGLVSDVDDPATPLDGLIVTTNTVAGVGSVMLLDESLTEIAERVFSIGGPASSVAVDALGDAYVTSNDGFAGTACVVNRFATQRGVGFDVSFNPARDRKLEIQPGIFFPDLPVMVDPMGIDVDSTTDLAIVSDPGFPGIWAFGRSAGNEAAEIVLIEEGFTEPSILPQGLDYDASSDRLFVAISNGTIFVYDNFVQSPGSLPDRVITPASAAGTTQASTSIRDVLYDAQRDVLFATDLGDASGVSNDGAVFVIEGASLAGGLAAARVITGANTGLDDPFDLAWNGENLWVSDAANETISRFEGALLLEGNVFPNATLVVPDVRSLAVVPSGLAPATGGSILGE